ncbi:hypothetical protein F4820DRAFT_420568 [Hypoxylon rubiginosum]|uniref:Uncharacterized protein n=1 Tax=Hypoxylon rubiginosum TaxID=110542 RepID=A0ACB9Z1T9_9PEZI|nr:hypothetical protein F4820DRAFT_420568 [Hypoxylon rubiginosum]
MKATLASLLVAFLPALTVVSALPDPNSSTVVDYSTQGISVSCSNIRLTHSRYLFAECLEIPAWRSSPAAVISASLDLDECFANYEGNLVYAYRNGHYSGSCACDAVGLNNATLSCICDGNENYSAFDLNNWHYIQNNLGILNCMPVPAIKPRMPKRYTSFAA